MQTAEKGGAADEAPSVKACLVYDSHTEIVPKVSRGGEACGDFCRAPTQAQAGTRPPPAQSLGVSRRAKRKHANEQQHLMHQSAELVAHGCLLGRER